MTEIHNNILAFTVAPPGAGKTYFSTRLEKVVPGLVRVSSDEIRKEITGSENDLSKDKEVWEAIHERVEIIANNSKDILFDATNVKFKNRNFLYKIAYKTNHHLVSFVLLTSKEKCFAQNKNRERVVPEDVIEKMFKNLEYSSLDEVDLVVYIDEFNKDNLTYRFRMLGAKSLTPKANSTYLEMWNKIEEILEIRNRFGNFS